MQRGTQPGAATKRGDQSPKELSQQKASRKYVASVKALEQELLDKYKQQALKAESPGQEEVSYHCDCAARTLRGLRSGVLQKASFESRWIGGRGYLSPEALNSLSD